MSAHEVWLSREGYDKLLAQLSHLKSTRRREIAADLERARAQGDLRENAEYDAAKEAQAHTERQIAALEHTLARARILDEAGIPTDKAYIGATLTLYDAQTKTEVEYRLVAAAEADYDAGKISVESPIGRGLLGHAEGETVTITVPRGAIQYTILKIRRG